jgi:hypothetical protein
MMIGMRYYQFLWLFAFSVDKEIYFFSSRFRRMRKVPVFTLHRSFVILDCWGGVSGVVTAVLESRLTATSTHVAKLY